jgi:hypothetical protein
MLLRERILTSLHLIMKLNNAYKDMTLHFGARMKSPVLE